MKYAYIITNNKALETDNIYTYIIPNEFKKILKIGMRVIIPFGRGNRKIMGIVIDIKHDYFGEYKLKEIIDIIDEQPIISEDLVELSLWMRDEYISSHLESIKNVLPPGDIKEIEIKLKIKNRDELNIKQKKVIDYIDIGLDSLDKLKQNIEGNIYSEVKEMIDLNILESEIHLKTKINKNYERYILNLNVLDWKMKVSKQAKKQYSIMEYLFDNKINTISQKELLTLFKTSLSVLKELEKKSLIKFVDLEIYRDGIKKNIKKYNKHKLTNDQKNILETIISSKDKDFLLHGVTGSGKTEIYLQLVEEMLYKGKDSIILVPEISLTPQTIDRFVGRFGKNVAVYHSKLSYGERFDEWRKIKNGDVKIVVGVRSAVFSPFKNLGLIIIDEEHDQSYKSDMNPKYNTIDVARKRISQIEGAKIIRGSATPSLTSYYQAEKKQIKLLKLPKRINNSFPEIKVIDMREEINKGNISMFSESLFNNLNKSLENKNQSLLFLNRRGFSTFISCRQCGYVVKCNDCEISLTYHRNINMCKCHYCGKTRNTPKICPSCGSRKIKHFGVGTEQIESYTKKTFPNANVDRMDFETVRKKNSHNFILEKFKKGETDILVGTQMISKGLDFPNVDLVGVIAADTSLNIPDFRSAERTFQLLTQVSGRAGRGNKKGKVIIQTYEPDNYSIIYSKNNDYEGFYKEEIKLREEFKYPPFFDIYKILLTSDNMLNLISISNSIVDKLKSDLKSDSYEILGPYPCPIEKIKNNLRYQIFIKVSSEHKQNKLKEVIKKICIKNKYKLNFKSIKVSIDINPTNML